MKPEEVYFDEFIHKELGHPMWQADPLEEYENVEIGDVGYIRFGKFNPLFNIRTKVFKFTSKMRRLDAPRPLESESINSVEIEVGVSAEPIGPLGSAQAGIGYKCSKSHGAVLALIDKFAHGEDCDLNGKKLLGEYMLKNYKQWLREHSELECRDLVLITGYHRTRDWEAVLFSSSSKTVSGNLSAAVAMTVSAHAKLRIQKDPGDSLDFASGHHHQDDTKVPPCCVPVKQNQSIFLRGWRMRERIILPPKLKAAAGYDQLPGPDRDHTDAPEVEAELEHFPHEPEPPHNIYDKVFDHLFLHGDADIAMVHDDDIVATLKTQKSFKGPVLTSSDFFTCATIRLSSRDISFLSSSKMVTSEVAGLTSAPLWRDLPTITRTGRIEDAMSQILPTNPSTAVVEEVNISLAKSVSMPSGDPRFVALGRLVLAPATPNLMSLGLKSGEDYVDIAFVDKKYIKTSVGPPLALLPKAALRLLTKPKLFSTVVKAYTDDEHKTHTLIDPTAVLHKYVSPADDWLENHVESSSPPDDKLSRVYMITGFHTISDYHFNEEGWVTRIGTRVGTRSSDPSRDVLRSSPVISSSEILEEDGYERIVMVQYREVKLAQRSWFPFSSQSARWALESATHWTSVTGNEEKTVSQGGDSLESALPP